MLVLTPSQRDQIIEQAKREAPDECCGIVVGIISGEQRIVNEVHPVQNVWEGDRRKRFMIDARVHLRLQREVRELQQTIIGFYHSHPTGTPNPSAFDAELAWPDHSYLIVSLPDCVMKSWQLDEQTGQFVEEQMQIDPR
jgi:proteasome lid subunit RPN8/RPN11